MLEKYFFVREREGELRARRMKKVDRTRVHFIQWCNPQSHTKDMIKKRSRKEQQEGGIKGKRKSTYDLVNKLRLNYTLFILVA